MDRKHITWLSIGNPVFLFSVLVFLFYEASVEVIPYVFVHSYLNDLLAPIIILTITQFVLSFYQKKYYRLSVNQLLFFLVYISLFFEYFLPSISESYISDAFDVLVYALGVLTFHILINKETYEPKRNHTK